MLHLRGVCVCVSVCVRGRGSHAHGERREGKAEEGGKGARVRQRKGEKARGEEAHGGTRAAEAEAPPPWLSRPGPPPRRRASIRVRAGPRFASYSVKYRANRSVNYRHPAGAPPAARRAEASASKAEASPH